jgi:hypothetical protein
VLPEEELDEACDRLLDVLRQLGFDPGVGAILATGYCDVHLKTVEAQRLCALLESRVA